MLNRVTLGQIMVVLEPSFIFRDILRRRLRNTRFFLSFLMTAFLGDRLRAGFVLSADTWDGMVRTDEGCCSGLKEFI